MSDREGLQRLAHAVDGLVVVARAAWSRALVFLVLAVVAVIATTTVNVYLVVRFETHGRRLEEIGRAAADTRARVEQQAAVEAVAGAPSAAVVVIKPGAPPPCTEQKR